MSTLLIFNDNGYLNGSKAMANLEWENSNYVKGNHVDSPGNGDKNWKKILVNFWIESFVTCLKANKLICFERSGIQRYRIFITG